METFQEYHLRLCDPYWTKIKDELVSKGLPEFIVRPALIKAERSISAQIAYQ